MGKKITLLLKNKGGDWWENTEKYKYVMCEWGGRQYRVTY